MNIVTLIGRLTRDPEVRYTGGDKPLCIASYTLAVNRPYNGKEGKIPEADFINCKCFDKVGEFAEKYLRKGMKIAVRGRINTGSYKNREGENVYYTEVVVEEHEFCEKK